MQYCQYVFLNGHILKSNATKKLLYDGYPYFPFWSIEQENVEQLSKYGKAHIVYSPTKYKWVVSDKFKQ